MADGGGSTDTRWPPEFNMPFIEIPFRTLSSSFCRKKPLTVPKVLIIFPPIILFFLAQVFFYSPPPPKLWGNASHFTLPSFFFYFWLIIKPGHRFRPGPTACHCRLCLLHAGGLSRARGLYRGPGGRKRNDMSGLQNSPGGRRLPRKAPGKEKEVGSDNS